jgi:hypothetical protein
MRAIMFIALSLATQFAYSLEEYANPVDRKVYVADWKTYQSNGNTKEHVDRVINSGVRLLSTQQDFDKNTTPNELAKLLGFIQEVLTKESEKYNEGGEIRLYMNPSGYAIL